MNRKRLSSLGLLLVRSDDASWRILISKDDGIFAEGFRPWPPRPFPRATGHGGLP